MIITLLRQKKRYRKTPPVDEKGGGGLLRDHSPGSCDACPQAGASAEHVLALVDGHDAEHDREPAEHDRPEHAEQRGADGALLLVAVRVETDDHDRDDADEPRPLSELVLEPADLRVVVVDAGPDVHGEAESESESEVETREHETSADCGRVRLSYRGHSIG